MELSTTEAKIFKWGSGAGVNLSSIRGKGEPLAGGGEASGPVSFMKGLDSFAGVIKSGGKKRRAAKMIILDADHPDIEDFVHCKTKEEEKAFALIEAGYDPGFNIEGGAYESVLFQNANHSVRVKEEFFEAVENDDEWELTWRGDGTIEDTKKVSARALMRQIAEAAWHSGDPGVQYDSNIHTWHTCKNAGRQVASNPCSEYLWLNKTACNLSSINLLKFRCPEGFRIDDFKHVVDLLITAQDILVGYADYPTPEIERETVKWRTLGLGYANLGALIMADGRPYDSPEGRALAASITSLMTGEAYAQSARIAKTQGAFEGFKGNEGCMTEVIELHKQHAQNLYSDLWKDSSTSVFAIADAGVDSWDRALELGIWRNAQVSVLAPTGTISFYMDCDTTGIEPGLALVSYKRLVGGGMFKIVNKTVPLALMSLGYSQTDIEDVVEYIENNDTIEGAPHLTDEDLPVFDCAFEPASGTRSIAWKGHIHMMAAVQPFLSGAISKTVNMPSDATVEDIEEAYMMGQKLGLKALAIYRDGCKQSQPLSTKGDDDESSEIAEAEEVLGEGVLYGERRRLPDERPSITHKFSINGHEGYITVGLYEDGRPGEIFVVMAKQGSTLAGFVDSFATSVSIALQYGVPLEVFVRKFKHTRFEPCGFTSNPDIRSTTSVVDYIVKWLESKFITSDESVQPAPELKKLDMTSTESKSFGPSCSECGGLTMQNGTCHVCTSCGATTGCG